MKSTLETKLGMFFAVALIAVLLILEYLGGFGFLKQGYHVQALFKNIQELKPGDQVKMAGVRVGRVKTITLTNDQVQVTMDLNKDLYERNQVKTDSKATVRFTGLMGQNFVAIDFGSPGGARAENGAILQSVEQPDLSQIMSKIDNVASGVENLTKSFSGESIEKLLGPMREFMESNQKNLTATIGNLKVVSDNIASGKGTVGKLINEDTLYVSALNTISNLQNTASDVQKISDDAHVLLTNANFIVTQINAGKGTVGKLINDESLFIEARGSLTNLHQILLKINHGEGSVGKLVNDESLLKNVKLSLQKLDKATESLEDTGPLSVLGTMVNSLF